MAKMGKMATAAGLPLIHVPATGLRHLLESKESDDWVWTRKDRFGLTPESVAQVLNISTAESLQWYYGSDASVFTAARTYCESIGLKTPIVPMMDGAGRLSTVNQVAVATALWNEFGSIGLFNPCGVSTALRDLLAKFARE